MNESRLPLRDNILMRLVGIPIGLMFLVAPNYALDWLVDLHLRINGETKAARSARKQREKETSLAA